MSKDTMDRAIYKEIDYDLFSDWTMRDTLCLKLMLLEWHKILREKYGVEVSYNEQGNRIAACLPAI